MQIPIRNGDREGESYVTFEELYPRAYAMARARRLSALDAEEAAQEACLVVWQLKICDWLQVKRAINKVRDRLRRERERSQPLSSLPDNHPALVLNWTPEDDYAVTEGEEIFRHRLRQRAKWGQARGEESYFGMAEFVLFQPREEVIKRLQDRRLRARESQDSRFIPRGLVEKDLIDTVYRVEHKLNEDGFMHRFLQIFRD